MKTNKKNKLELIISMLVMLGLTAVLLFVMKNSSPFNTDQFSALNSSPANIKSLKTSNNDKSIIVGALLLMTLITIKVRKTINQI